ncbi:hypothetical protein BpHYR1_030329, partial [Brachionus plicatilis]
MHASKNFLFIGINLRYLSYYSLKKASNKESSILSFILKGMGISKTTCPLKSRPQNRTISGAVPYHKRRRTEPNHQPNRTSRTSGRTEPYHKRRRT